MQSAAALSEWLLIDICRATHRTQFDGKENMVNVPSRKRFSEAAFQKVFDEKNELEQCNTQLQEENASLRRNVKKVKRNKKACKVVKKEVHVHIH